MDTKDLLVGLPSIVVLGVLAQWLAWRLRLPAILLLLFFGCVAGPGTAWLADQGIGSRFLDPDLLLGGLLLPVVSLFVAIILFEGGLTLNLAELRQAGRVILNLVSIGALCTWVVVTAAAWGLLGLDFELSLLLGSILVVTGPTVVGPLLRHVRPTGPVGPILKWEGIVIDPIGVLLTVVVFEALAAKGAGGVTTVVAWSVIKTVFVGSAAGFAGAGLLVLLLRKYWVPDFLQSPMTLAVVVGAFAASNVAQHESGLFTVTIMGIVLANQKLLRVKHILEFKESLTVLLVSSLFIMLGARLRLHDLAALDWTIFAFLAVLIFVARPLSVLASTRNSGLGWRDKTFLMCMAPRGIVAASVSSVFAIRLLQEGYEDAPLFVPYVFSVIIGTVLFYGLLAPIAARKLGLSRPGRRDFLISGANVVARAIASALKGEGYDVLLVDTNRENLEAARKRGLPIYYGSILSENVAQKVELSGIGRLLALTPNEEVNSLAAVRFERVFGQSEVYQLSPGGPESGRGEKISYQLRGRGLFGAGVTYERFADWLEAGARIETVRLRPDFDWKRYRAEYGDGVVPLFLIEESKAVQVFTPGQTPTPRAGQAVVTLVKGEARPAGEEAAEGKLTAEGV